jgi:hypothetical protein
MILLGELSFRTLSAESLGLDVRGQPVSKVSAKKEPEHAQVPEQVPEPKIRPTCKEFRIQVTRAEGEPLGVMLDCLDGTFGQLLATKEGALADYGSGNTAPCHHDQLQIGDFIVEVNGKSGDIDTILGELQSSTDIDMLVRRGTPFRVDVRASPGSEYGQSLSKSMCQSLSACTLLIQEVHELFEQWNAANPQMLVMKHDRVLEVNGKRGNLDLMRKEIQQSNELSFLIQSPFP